MTTQELLRLRARYLHRVTVARTERLWHLGAWLASVLVVVGFALDLSVLFLWGCT